MAHKDNTFSTGQIKKISECHSSLGKNNQLAAPKLQRWKDLNQAIIDWMNNDALEDTSIAIAEKNNFQFYDEIQKNILINLFAKFRELYPKTNVEFDFSYITKESTQEINEEEYAITSHFTYTYNDGISTEFVKLKTAHDPDPALIDRAIITKFKQENENYITAALEKNELQDIESVDNPDEIIEQHFEILNNYLNNRQKRNPGDQCTVCNMSSRCGQFPLINADKITNRVREVKISKTNLVKLNNCERRAAWNVQYGLPREDYVEFETESTATKFHTYTQKMLVNNANFLDTNNIDSFNNLTNDEEEITRENLFKKYSELVSQLKEYKNLNITDSEYQLGFTCIVDGLSTKDGEVIDKKVATIYMGKADLVGRADGIPIVVELKTRPEIPEDLLEAQLYALGASLILKTDEVIVLHIYSLNDQTFNKERRFELSELESVKKKFIEISKKPASWLPFDAMSAKYTLGDWCQFCEFKITCSEYR